MRRSLTFIKLIAITLLCSLAALGQTAGSQKQFNKEGLAFDYPAGWELTDSSNSDAQQLVLSKDNSDAQIRVFVFRGLVDTPEKQKVARTKLVDPYLNATSSQFEQMGAKPTRVPATLQVGTLQAEGVRIQAVLDGDPGEAAIYWLTLGNRLVVLTFFGPDRALKQAAPAWDAIRNTLRVEAEKPAQ
jgi:hypothetical protein